jgi:hypothetical protein
MIERWIMDCTYVKKTIAFLDPEVEAKDAHSELQVYHYYYEFRCYSTLYHCKTKVILIYVSKSN